mmetsp:Transcript_69568/g.141450  ORF Transcript_69568/g.141450 Transcript_69568/m.141450 type:complete len:187 (-) Transcript_69568:212-772(-)|eukprot:CAMPEP_0201186766 /NCGR_PEP_ID=MMETSP0851-20130426/132107_1 /ASSEMBLY_ACC=CAM_ASM_000631 /TAXON_ID=183588 /ORGANISM="Pseudo-nitzschia fraudulenta, Strain WWA7" /LENGTH=186 /DNA_ID=CAMNT_0047472121 /DNA_START=85 /DNA_END=645 /DNA_ORIENTATION=+
MTIIKKTQNRNNMLFMLASLACGQDGSRSSTSTGKQTMSRIAAVSEVSDDDGSVAAASSSKESVVVRRKRRPIKKRIPMSDYRPSTVSSSSFVKPRKSLLESSIDIICNSPRRNRRVLAQSEPSTVEKPNNEPSESIEASDELPTLVSDDEAWKHVHSPLVLPSYLPCPSAALKDVESICLTLVER